MAEPSVLVKTSLKPQKQFSSLFRYSVIIIIFHLFSWRSYDTKVMKTTKNISYKTQIIVCHNLVFNQNKNSYLVNDIVGKSLHQLFNFNVI